MAGRTEVTDKRREKFNKMGGKQGVKDAMLTAFIATGESKNLRANDIADAAKVHKDDKRTRDHIDMQLRRRDARK